MGIAAIGTVFLYEFPFTDFKRRKKRPALVVGHSSLNSLIICSISSQNLPNVKSVAIEKKDFCKGQLPKKSYARFDKLLTTEQKFLEALVGQLNDTKTQQIRKEIAAIFEDL